MSSPEAPGPARSGWIAVALLGKTRGNRGEIIAFALSGKPERYEDLRDVQVFGPGNATRTLSVEDTWFHNGTLVFKFQGVDTISDAEGLTGGEVCVPVSERVALDQGEYFQSDLIGCEVVDRHNGQLLGRVTGWEDSGGAGLLVVDRDWLIPFARSICVEIDPVTHRIAVELPDGLKDINCP